MKAVCWHSAQDVRVETVPDPKILNPRDAIIKVTSTKRSSDSFCSYCLALV